MIFNFIQHTCSLTLEGSLLLVDGSLALIISQTSNLALLGFGLELGKVLFCWLVNWIVSDSLMSVLVELLEILGPNILIDIRMELLLVLFVIFLLEVLHVLGDVAAVNVLAECLGVELLALDIVSWETVFRVWDKDATIASTLHGCKDLAAGRGSLQADIKEGLERTWAILDSLDFLLCTIWLGKSFIFVGETKLGERTACDKEASSVGCSPVGQSMLDAILWQLMRVGRSEDKVSLDLGIDDLADDVLVCEADNKSVFWRVVFVLGLRNQALASIVVGLSLCKVSTYPRKSKRKSDRSERIDGMFVHMVYSGELCKVV